MSGVQPNLNIKVIRQRKQMRWETQDKGANQRWKPTGLATPHCKQLARGPPGRRSPSQLLEEEEGREHPTQEPRQVGAQNGCGEVEGITSGGWPAAEGLLRYLEVRQSPPLRGSLLLSFIIHRAKPGGGGTQEGLRL